MKIALANQLEVKKKDDDHTPCKGKIYRMITNTFLSQHNSFHENIQMRPMKRKSCPGCNECLWMDELLQEYVQEGEVSIDHETIVDGGLFKLVFTDGGVDWESGEVEEFFINFVPYKEEEHGKEADI